MPELALPDEVATSVKKFDAALSALETALEPIAEMTPRQVDAQLAPLQRAQFHVTVAEAINVLFQMYLKTQGVSPEEHPVAKEVERLKLYRRKVNKAIFEANGLGERATSINISAAARFIDSAIPDLSQEQKKQIAAVGRRAQQATSHKAHSSAQKQPLQPAHAPAPRGASASSAPGDAPPVDDLGAAPGQATAAPKRAAEQPAGAGVSAKKHKAKKYPLGNVMAQADAFLRSVGAELTGGAPAGHVNVAQGAGQTALGMARASGAPGSTGKGVSQGEDDSAGSEEDAPKNLPSGSEADKKKKKKKKKNSQIQD